MDKHNLPVWLLDVDGVLNAMSRNTPTHVWKRDQWTAFDQAVVLDASGKDSYPILAALPVLDFLRDVHARGLAEIRWHTTWRQDDSYRRLAASLDLPEFPVAVAPEFDWYLEGERIRAAGGQTYGYTALRPVWWKLGAAERVLADEDRPLLWTDDDLNTEARRHRGVAAVMQHPRVLAINPQSTLGLITKNLRVIRDWLDTYEQIRSRASADEAAR